MQYRILSNTTSISLSELVNSAIKEGWIPQGGICFVLGTVHNYYIQAVIKHD